MLLQMFTGVSLVLLQAQTEVDFISQLYTLSPIIGCLVIGIGYLVYSLNARDKKISEKEAELKELHKYVRDSDAENIKILEKVSSTLDRVMEQEKNGNSIVLKEIDNLKQLILIKLKN